MARKTRKVGVAGKYGPRYGVKVRHLINDVESTKNKKHTCPRCRYPTVKRLSTAVWHCRHCDLKFAGGAYTPVTTEGAIKARAIKVAAAEAE